MSSRRTETHWLPEETPGTRRFLRLHRYGAGPRKVYVQAALHADETPAQLVALHLLDLLDEADRADALRAEIVVVPAANPIGLSQHSRSHLQGRFHQRTGRNFNRGWPDLTPPPDILGPDADANVATVRAHMLAAADALPGHTEELALRRLLTREAAGAELVLDLHCDDVALPYLYIAPRCWPSLADLAARLGARAVLAAEDSGGGSFDEVFSLPWAILARERPDVPVPQATDSLTVELRGSADVSDDLARQDARALLEAMAARGLIELPVPAAPPLRCTMTPLDACERLTARAPGVAVYAVALGQEVRRGDLIAEVRDPMAEDPRAARVRHVAGTDGTVLSLCGHRATVPGQTIAKIVGREPIADAALLAD